MIKIGIAGAETAVAGELLRLAIHHPDIDIITAYAPEKTGRSITTLHHGFIGEESINIGSNFDATGLDAAFIVSPIFSSSDWAKLMADCPGLKLILFPESEDLAESLSRAPVYGVPEMNRKALVRGARVAMLPTPIASPIIVALYPLASHLMLTGDLNIDLIAPYDLLTPESILRATFEIEENMKRIQTSFNGNVVINANKSSGQREFKAVIELPSLLTIDEILKIYDSIYDDHNFTFMVTHSVDNSEVEGTNRVILSLSKPSNDRLRIECVADARMRGGAGEAIHILNLLFNLHEKTGLNLKASRWE